jgi:hypothetical protein
VQCELIELKKKFLETRRGWWPYISKTTSAFFGDFIKILYFSSSSFVVTLVEISRQIQKKICQADG